MSDKFSLPLDGGLTPSEVAAENLRAAAEDMEDSAWRMGIERDSPLGIWVVTMRRSLTQLADITEKLSGGVTNTIRNGKALIEAEVERLQTVRETATIQLHEATAALTKAQVEAEKLTLRTLNDLIPKIVDQIRDAVVIREKRYNRTMRWRQYALISAATVGLMVGGYSLRAWQDLDATSALARCAAATTTASDGSEYCALKSLLPQALAQPAQQPQGR